MTLGILVSVLTLLLLWPQRSIAERHADNVSANCSGTVYM